MRQFTCPKAVTHPSTNRARCRATALIETNALPLHQTTNQMRNRPMFLCLLRTTNLSFDMKNAYSDNEHRSTF